MTTITHSSLKEKQRNLREGFPSSMGLRVHRSISWIGRAEKEKEDEDAQFVFLWIAFNAAYASEEEFQGIHPVLGDRGEFKHYFTQLVKLDEEQRIYNALWERFSGPVRVLMNNRYVFHYFWRHHNGMIGSDDWEIQFRKSEWHFRKSFESRKTAEVLGHVFDRLYVLRNQIIHGGSTWNSSVNRDQVRDGASILGFLMPVFIDIMMEHPHEYWGQPFYPVV